jgi:hypothetical protein
MQVSILKGTLKYPVLWFDVYLSITHIHRAYFHRLTTWFKRIERKIFFVSFNQLEGSFGVKALGYHPVAL